MTWWTISRKLTVMSAVLVAVVLAIGSAFLVVQVRSALDRSLDTELRQRFEDLDERGSRSGELTQASRVQQVIADADGPAQAYDARGARRASSPSLRDVTLLRERDVRAAPRSGVRLMQVRNGGRRYRVAVGRPVGNDMVAALAVNLRSRDDALSDLELQLLVGCLLVLVSVTALAWWLSQRVLRPVEQLRQQASLLAADGRERTLGLPNTVDEIGRLTVTLNELLDRLYDSLRRERQFVADAGHELRTPLALLAAEIEFALEQPRTADVHEQTLRTLQVETLRLAALAEDLLQVGVSGTIDASDIDVGQLVATVVDRVRARAALDERSVRATVDDGRPITVRGDRSQLDRVVTNLVDNAVRHGTGDVEVRVSVDDDARDVRVEVEDEGPGFPPGFAARAFDRFSRGDAARTGDGSGLGLAIVQTIVVAHGGRVVVVDRVPGAGPGRALVRVNLPKSSA